MDLRQFPQNPKALLIEAKDKIIALESQLAAMTARAEKAEAEQVEVVNFDDYCNTFACAMSCDKDRCSLWQLYCWLRDHNMIREAE